MKRTPKTVINLLISIFILFTCAMIYVNIRAIWDPSYRPPVGKFLIISPAARENLTAMEGLGMLNGPGGFVIVTIVILLIIIVYEIINIIREIKAAEKSKKLSERLKKMDFINKKRSYSE